MARFIHGIHPALEALRSQPDAIDAVFAAEVRGSRALEEVLSLARSAGIQVETVPRAKLNQLAEGGVHQGVVLRLQAVEYADFEALASEAAAQGARGLLLMLDGVEDPHNFGALCRSASALGAQGVVIARDRAAGITPTAVKSSAGALLHLKVARVTNLSRALERLREVGFWSVAADVSGDRPPEGVTYDMPTLVVVGSEGRGIRRNLLEKCDFKVRIPMVGPISSLNASVAGAVLLAEVARQRRCATAK